MPDVIGLFLRSAENAYQRQLRAVAIREAEKRGFQLLIQTAQFDVNQQMAQIHAAIRNAAATHMIAIRVSGVRDEDLIPLAHEAADAGMEWGLLNDGAYIDELHQQHPDRAIFAAASDQTEIGRLQADQIRTFLGPQGRVMCITGNQRNVEARLRLEGLKQGLGDDFEVIEVNADWTSEGGRRA